MNKQQAQKTVKIFSIIYLILGCINILAGIFFVLARNQTFITALQTVDANITPTVLFNASISMFVLALLFLLTSYFLKHHTKKGRIFSIILSIIILFSFPIGTVVGAAGIYIFTRNKHVIQLLKR